MTLSNVAVPAALNRLPRPSRRAVVTSGWWILAVVGAKLVAAVLDATHVAHVSTPLPAVLLGAIIGLTYGLLAVGLVLVYRSNRIINFAHGQIGAFGSAFFGLAVVRWHVPYWIGLPFALMIGGGVGMAAEAGVVRRLRKAPRLMSIVATLGVGEFLVLFSEVINGSASAGSSYPQPPFIPSFNLGPLFVNRAYAGILVVAPIVVLALAIFLRRSAFGLGIRSAADNPEAARMAGISVARMSGLAWFIAGALSTVTAVLTAPTSGFRAGDSFGPALLLRAMTAAVVARMTSLPQALFAGIALGVVEQLLLFNYPNGGLVEAALFVIITTALLLQRHRGGRDEEKGSWAAVQALSPMPAALARLPFVRSLRYWVGGTLLLAAAGLPLLTSNTMASRLTSIVCIVIVGLSVGLLTGLAGQLTLGMFAVAGVGGVICYQVSSRTGDFPLAFLYAGLGAAVVSMLLGLPALRIRGLMLTVTTLSFALAAPEWLFPQSWMLGAGRDPGRPVVFGHPLTNAKDYYWFSLAIFVVALVICLNVRRSGFARLLIAIRDNEDNARAFTVRAGWVKIQAYVLAGFVAGLGGAAFTHSLSLVSFSNFRAPTSVDVVVIAVIGGISVLSGPVLGALYVLGVPLLPLDSAGLAATNFGALLLILWKPAGVIQLVEPLRTRLFAWLAARHGIDLSEPTEAQAGVAVPGPRDARTLERYSPPENHVVGSVLLEVDGLHRAFGGIKAVDGISFQVRAGETVGLIGPNGAGKTTAFELISGFTRPEAGHVLLEHRDITRLSPEERGRLGLIRSFQDAALFSTLTVLDCVQLALHRTAPTSFASALTGVSFASARKERDARDLVHFFGLDPYRDKQVQALSTGTRRITEIACLVALQPRLLLLDEPSSGVAQRETEALGLLLEELKRQLGVTLLVIEHDIPLIMGISDRIIAMADGVVIAAGSPEDVRAAPAVVEAYLGGSLTAIERSGEVIGAAR